MDANISRLVRLLSPPALIIVAGSILILVLPAQAVPDHALSPMKIFLSLLMLAGLAWLMSTLVRLLWCELEEDEGREPLGE